MEETLHHTNFIELLAKFLLFFGIAGVFVPILQRFKISPVLGYILGGLLIGPHALGALADEYSWLQNVTIRDSGTVDLLGELGIIALLFMIGLHLSFERLREMRRYILGLGSLQIILTGALIFGVSIAFGNSVPVSILLGASLALSSTAIVMQLLNEKHMLNRPVGRLTFSILLMQDFAVVPILILIGAFTGSADENVLYILGSAVAIAIAAVLIIYIGGKKLLRPLMHTLSFTNNAEWLMAFTLFVVCLAAMFTLSAGLSAALGAFLAGLLISETEFQHEISVIIEPLKNILLGIFFLSIGMMINPAVMVDNLSLVILAVAGLFVLKPAVLYPLCRLFGIPRGRAAEVSIILAQPGEFALLILSVAYTANVVSQEDVQFFLMVTVLAMLLTPFLMRLAPAVAMAIREKELEHGSTVEEESKVIIAGYGRIGKLVGERLEQHGVPYMAIDNNADRVRNMQIDQLPIYYGDARRLPLWKKLDVNKTTAVVVTLDDPEAAREILHMVRKQDQAIPVIMRAFDTDVVDDLYDHGATYVIPEMQESALQVSRALLDSLGIENDDLKI
ncbi:MAG: cation:proton antiporter [Pseudomonadota bacterium]